MSFKDMKRKSVGSISELTKKLESAEKKNSYQDDRFWKPTLDKASNADFEVSLYFEWCELEF